MLFCAVTEERSEVAHAIEAPSVRDKNSAWELGLTQEVWQSQSNTSTSNQTKATLFFIYDLPP